MDDIMYFPLEDGSFDLDDVDLSIIHTVEGPLINDPHPTDEAAV